MSYSELCNLGYKYGTGQSNQAFWLRKRLCHYRVHVELRLSLLTCIDEDSSILAFSAASFRRCTAMLSLVMSIPCCNRKINPQDILGKLLYSLAHAHQSSGHLISPCAGSTHMDHNQGYYKTVLHRNSKTTSIWISGGKKKKKTNGDFRLISQNRF